MPTGTAIWSQETATPARARIAERAAASRGQLFGPAESIFARYGGRPHWGQLDDSKAADLARLYPRCDDLRALRRRLDPKGKRLNAHLRGIFGE